MNREISIWMIGVMVVAIGTVSGGEVEDKDNPHQLVEEDMTRPVTFEGVTGAVRTSNTYHHSLAFRNRSDRVISAFRGSVVIYNDFGEVESSIPVEVTSDVVREERNDGETERRSFFMNPHEKVHLVEIHFTDFSNPTDRFVVTDDEFESVLESELVLPVDETEQPEMTFSLRIVVFDDGEVREY